MAESTQKKTRTAKEKRSDLARLTAVQVLYAVYEKKAYANLSIRQSLDDVRLTAQDRRFATALIYETLSRTYTIDWLLRQVSSRPLEKLDSWVLTILRMGIWQIVWSRSVPVSAAIDESVRLTRRFAGQSATGFVNAVLRQTARKPIAIPPRNGPLQTGLKPELYGCFKKWYGEEEALLLGESFIKPRTTVTVRVNRKQTSVDTLLQMLADRDIEVEKGQYSRDALSLRLKGQPITQLKTYQDGLLSVQDEAAMLVADAANPQPDILIIDLCAAPGGKICHLAERIEGRAQLLAFDIHASRLQLVREQAQRLGLNDFIQCFQANAVPFVDKTSDERLSTWLGKADIVLADVPCSGLGLLGRKPEIRLTMTYQRMRAFEPMQAAILDRAVSLVKPGGVIIYSTCTINPAENNHQIKALIERSQGMIQTESLVGYLPSSLLEHHDLSKQAVSGAIQLLPHRHGTDGFFIARLRKERNTV